MATGRPPKTAYLTDEEINQFLDDLDHNKDGHISYAEVEAKLDHAHDELAPNPHPFHILTPQNDPEKPHDGPDDQRRHEFLRQIIGSDAQRIPRDDFAKRVREWRIPSLQQDQKGEDAEAEYLHKLSVWRRLRAYWAVHGPEILFLGLVVGMQLAFGIWQLVKYLTTDPYRQGFGWGVVMAKTCAGALYPTFFFLILSMSRYFSTFLRRSYHVSRFINWDLSQSFHIIMSIVAVILATLHAIAHLSGSFRYGSMSSRQDSVAKVLGEDAVPVGYTFFIASRPGWTGLACLAMFYTIGLLSLPQVRKWNYEVFQLGHLLMFPLIALLCLHGTLQLFQWTMFGYFLAFPTLLVIVERVVRVALGFHGIPAQLVVLDDETVEIKANIPSERLWKYQAGQYVFLQVPKLSFFQWHPFTVSVCKDREMTLHIKTDGNWTKKLQGLGNKDAPTEIEIGINGPFGAPAQRFYDFSHSIIVGAGIGVTPFSGILADLQNKDDQEHGGPEHHKHHNSIPNPYDSRSPIAQDPLRKDSADSDDTIQYPTPPSEDEYRRVDFHWIVRDRNYLQWFSNLLNHIVRSQSWHREHEEHPHLDIRIQTHVTQSRRNIVTHVYRWLLEMHRTPTHPESPLTGLLNPTRFGRPDMGDILSQHYEDMKKYQALRRRRRRSSMPAGPSSSSEDDDITENEEIKVGVFFCGTPIVGEILADACRELTARGRKDGSKIEYFFMLEVFS